MKKSQKQSAKKGEDKKQSSLTRQKLVDFLARSAEVERKLEIIKEMLAEEEDYSPASLFHRIDSARQGFINERNLESFLKEQGLNFKGSELKMLFGRVN
jgi:transposase